MMRQGRELAIARLHPEFDIRLANAIREARAEGSSAGIFPAYRPPAFGPGGLGSTSASASTTPVTLGALFLKMVTAFFPAVRE
jgi:hypothetical protein